MMKCSQCGQELRDDAQFCSNCGHSVESPVSEPIKHNKGEKGVYALSILALMIVIAMMAYGCYIIISRDLHPDTPASASDETPRAFNYNSVTTDPALVGKWRCKDRAVADYDDSRFGVEVSAVLSMTSEGQFTLDYSMSDTGVPAMTLHTSGKYATDEGIVTFLPDETEGAEHYLKKHGSRPAFKYFIDENSFTLRYENGKDIVFNRVKEKKKTN